MADAIACERLRKGYGDTGRGGQAVLRDVTLRVRDGEFFGLAGVNGAGKTTLIKCLLDFCDLDAGSIALFGVDHRRAAARARIAYLPEKFTPPGYLRGRDFLRYMAELYGVSFPRRAVAEILEALDLHPSALDKPVIRLAKGMAQKLGLAACLLSRRRLLIMDEPMSGLDPVARAGLRHHLRTIKRRHAFLFCAHQLRDLENLCDNIGILHHGTLKYHGPPEQCRERHGGGDLEQAYLRCVAGARHTLPGR